MSVHVLAMSDYFFLLTQDTPKSSTISISKGFVQYKPSILLNLFFSSCASRAAVAGNSEPRAFAPAVCRVGMWMQPKPSLPQMCRPISFHEYLHMIDIYIYIHISIAISNPNMMLSKLGDPKKVFWGYGVYSQELLNLISNAHSQLPCSSLSTMCH